VGRVADSINSGHFPASPGKHCRDCAYSAVCEFSATTKRRKSVNR
jgi:CRISPR/Cas system-associated exonuclease Cas4 (RecB family)